MLVVQLAYYAKYVCNFCKKGTSKCCGKNALKILCYVYDGCIQNDKIYANYKHLKSLKLILVSFDWNPNF